MKKYTDFRSEQIHINEIGPVGATIAAVTGLIGGAMALKKGLDKLKGYRESQKEKKANRESGVEIEIKKINPQTGEEYEELVPLSGRDANLDSEGVEKKRKEMQGKYNNLQKGKDKAEANKNIRKALGKGPKDIITKDDQKKGMALIKKELEPDSPEDEEEPETTPSDSSKDTPKDEPQGSGMATASDFVGKDIKDIPDNLKDAVQGLERKKLKTTKDVEAHMKRWGIDRVVGFSKKMGPSGMPSDYEYVKNSRVISFGDYLKEDVVSDLKKISKSKKDMEIKLSDGSEIPIDPMTADIFVKYIEGLKSSEQKRVINQIQRTERGFMKVLGKAHGE